MHGLNALLAIVFSFFIFLWVTLTQVGFRRLQSVQYTALRAAREEGFKLGYAQCHEDVIRSVSAGEPVPPIPVWTEAELYERFAAEHYRNGSVVPTIDQEAYTWSATSASAAPPSTST